MSVGPYTNSTITSGFVRYGNWTGDNYSANTSSPDFVPLTAEQKAVPGFDPFDAVSAVHDQAYDTAQQGLLLDLTNGVPGSAAMLSYLAALEQADRSFLATAPSAPATTAWGQAVQSISLEAISVKADWEAADIRRIQSDPAYAARLDALATPASTQQTLVDISGFDSTNATPESVAAFKSRLYGDNPFLAQSQDAIVAVSGAVQDPELVPEILSSGTAISLVLGNSVVAEVKASTLQVNDDDTVVLSGNLGSLALTGVDSLTFFPGTAFSPGSGGAPTFQNIASAVTGPDLLRDLGNAIGPDISQVRLPSVSGLSDMLHTNLSAPVLLGHFESFG